MKSPPKRGASSGTTALESGSVSPSLTVWPACERLAAVRTYGLRFDVNCSILFTELPLLERPAAARAAGFEAVEFWWPFADPVPADREAEAFVRALGDAGQVRVQAVRSGGQLIELRLEAGTCGMTW
jgi:hypothetical protein